MPIGTITIRKTRKGVRYMWSKFKWDMFVTSFIPLWVSIIIFDVWDIVYNAITEFPKDGKLVGRLLCFAKNTRLYL